MIFGELNTKIAKIKKYTIRKYDCTRIKGKHNFYYYIVDKDGKDVLDGNSTEGINDVWNLLATCTDLDWEGDLDQAWMLLSEIALDDPTNQLLTEHILSRDILSFNPKEVARKICELYIQIVGKENK